MSKYLVEINSKTATGYDQLLPKSEASIVDYSNTSSGLTATNVQAAIDELNTKASGAAEKWSTARTVTMTGDTTGTYSIDGSANVSYEVTVKDNSHNHTVSNVTGLQTALDGKLSTSGGSITGNLTVSGTITGGIVYGAYYNDYAELFRKREEDKFDEGDVLAIGDDGFVHLAGCKQDRRVVGVVSHSYGHLLGGNGDERDFVDYVPVGLAGVIPVKVSGSVSVGDLLYSSKIPGIACYYPEHINGACIGKALTKNIDGYVKMLILNC